MLPELRIACATLHGAMIAFNTSRLCHFTCPPDNSSYDLCGPRHVRHGHRDGLLACSRSALASCADDGRGAAAAWRAGEVAEAAGVEGYHGTMQRCASYPKLWHEVTTVSDALACGTSRQY